MRLVFFGAAGAVPGPSDGNTSFAIQAGGATVLVDASGSPVHSLLRAGLEPRELDAVVLTHAHTDHLYALPSLIHALWLMKRDKPLLLLADPTTAERAMALLELMGLPGKQGLFELRWRQAVDESVSLGDALRARLFPVAHSVPTCGVRIQTRGAALTYSADTAPSEAVVEQARGAQALVHEATGGWRQEGPLNAAGHSSARQAARAAARAGVPSLFLCHFDYLRPQVRQRMSREARRAFSGPIVCPTPHRWYQIAAL